MSGNSDFVATHTVRSNREPVGLQGNSIQIWSITRLCRLWRCRSLQCLSPSPRCRKRIAETRAVNRALRKAYGIGLCSVEELGWAPKPIEHTSPYRVQPVGSNGNGHHPRPPRLRDQLCLLIRQYELDPNLVKAYPAHFCGTETIKDASRDLVESFISHLAASAKEDRDGLICKLNSFAPVEVRP
jgi:hypothetical protein